ncbi:myo-inositol-1(or 4)-monophosphatase [Legionella busanensis]|uniref:Myo-inositol-1(Or 4)-monophosphatase n=1 Tax=Legionella busanensis TaxID=190655 RepID=A0A378JN04_9GAMM|nr:inositol monophosphatase family protein [Legionella busanensis]STX51390.1 myo-inositol-1(or 4)-monophosphatase [Legionella busanensis]
MDLYKLNFFEKKLMLIGDMIESWRNDQTAKNIIEPTEFKTQADLKAHELLSELIQTIFPNTIIISEEDYTHDFRPTNYWLIDPIDGTASWYNGFDGFVIQAAFIENNIPLYGAVYAPVLKKLWTARRNQGAWLNNCKLPKLIANERINLIDNYPEPKNIAGKIFNKIPITQYIECGSLGLKSCLVADGTADLFVKDVVIRDWDLAPAAVIINEVGGVLTDLTGEIISFTGSFQKNKGLIVARDKYLLKSIVKLTENQTVK